ncbi:PLP-dependent aminotransferase family protein [Bradyrhizobium sp. UFLA 03-164]|uniref:PLP-dependent aminotransferase family protein n=2 Tax=Bradyrhizobium uaiense TaxID=2594946 RepID=A0A6P1BJV4_9BRAD|nr:PLP-dependent aminotransferase family protein [Bradyrhizobium uaiense]
MPLVEQISGILRTAIVEGRLKPGARLPSWLDMAAQLGVARGTVKAAYERLADESLVVASSASGTRVAAEFVRPTEPIKTNIRPPLDGLAPSYYRNPLPFQMGVPAQDAFPAKLWARIRARAVRDDAMAPVGLHDPRGNPELRAQIASYVAIARGIRCVPDQIIITGGYRNGLALAMRTLKVYGKSAWLEEPGYPITRMGLQLDDVMPVDVPVDDQGIVVELGVRRAPNAAMAIVTPGQQAPTGVVLSQDRRDALLRWAERSGAWIIEDDYLSELQLGGRAAPALAAGDPDGRVVHIGSFSKTLSPTLGLGFLVAPLSLAERFGEVAACLQPAPNSTTQLALARVLADGHYLRHLRHMKSLYRERRDALRACLPEELVSDAMGGLALLLHLPKGTDDLALSKKALARGIAPMPLSIWWTNKRKANPGFVLGIANIKKGQAKAVSRILLEVVADAFGRTRSIGFRGVRRKAEHRKPRRS